MKIETQTLSQPERRERPGHAAAALHFPESLNKGNCPAIVSRLRDPGNL